MRQRGTRGRELAGGARLAAAISAGVGPALVALLVLLVMAESRTFAIGTALLIWVVVAAMMWGRFGRS